MSNTKAAINTNALFIVIIAVLLVGISLGFAALLSGKDTEIRRLDTRIYELTQQLKDAEDTALSSAGDKKNAEQNLEESVQLTQGLIDEKQRLLEQQQSLKSQCDALAKKISELKEKIKWQDERMAEIRRDADSLRAEKSEMAGRLKQLQSEGYAGRLLKENVVLRAKVDELAGHIDTAREEQLESENAQLRQRASELEPIVNKALEDLNTERIARQQLEIENKTLKEIPKPQLKPAASSYDDTAMLRERIAELGSKLKEAREYNKGIEMEKTALSREIESARRELSRLKNQEERKQNLFRQRPESGEDSAALKQEIARLTGEVSRHKRESAEKDKKIDKLKYLITRSVR